MTVKVMTVKERVLRRIDTLDEAQLLELEKQLEALQNEERVKRQLEALRAVAGSITEPEDVAALEEATKRRPFFGARGLDLEP